MPNLSYEVRIIGWISDVCSSYLSKGMAQYGDQDDLVIMPIKAVERRILGTTDIRALLVGVDAAYDTDQVKASLTDLLRERRRREPGEAADFRIVDPKQISETLAEIGRASGREEGGQ